MKILLAVALLSALAGACQSLPRSTPDDRRQAATTFIDNWTETSRLAAAHLIDEYGPPDRIEAGRLIWNDKGAWKKTVVWDQRTGFDSDGSANVVEQTVDYAVDPAAREKLRQFSDKIAVNKDGTELTARSESEKINYLTLNLADHLIKGDMDLLQANNFYAHTLDLEASGKQSSYTQGLLFSPDLRKK